MSQQPENEHAFAGQGHRRQSDDGPASAQEGDEPARRGGSDDEARLVGSGLPPHAQTGDSQGAVPLAACPRQVGPGSAGHGPDLRIGHARDGSRRQDDPIGRTAVGRPPDDGQGARLNRESADGDPPGSDTVMQSADARRSERGARADGGDHGARERQASPGGRDDQK